MEECLGVKVPTGVGLSVSPVCSLLVRLVDIRSVSQSVSHSVSQSISKHQVKPNNTMVKINTTEFRKQLSSRPTKTSVFMKFLTKISFFPITLDEAEGVIRFKLISKKTLAHVLIYWGLLLLIMSIMGAQMDVKVLSTIAEQNVFETFSIMAGNISYISIMF